MKNTRLFLLALGFVLIACDDNKSRVPAKGVDDANLVSQETKKSAPHVAVPSQYFEMIEVDEKIPDPSYDLGYRDKTLAYPKLVGAFPENIRAQVDRDIERLASTFKCRGVGDQSFTATVTNANEKLLSFKYEAMRMCAKSPAPSSTEGAATYNLQTGGAIDLNTEFANESTKKDFTAMATKSLTEGVAKKERDAEMECPKPIDIGYFFVTSTGLTVAYRSDVHYYSACTTEVQISKEALRRYLKPDSLLLN